MGDTMSVVEPALQPPEAISTVADKKMGWQERWATGVVMASPQHFLSSLQTFVPTLSSFLSASHPHPYPRPPSILAHRPLSAIDRPELNLPQC